MASIEVGGGHGRKKSVDSQLPLVPFIDLLLCCVMFLLVTAVWNEISSVAVRLPGAASPDSAPVERQSNTLVLHVAAERYVISTTSGLREVIERRRDAGEQLDLSTKLRALRALDPTLHETQVGADDGVSFAELMSVMDTALGAGFRNIALSEANL